MSQTYFRAHGRIADQLINPEIILIQRLWMAFSYPLMSLRFNRSQCVVDTRLNMRKEVHHKSCKSSSSVPESGNMSFVWRYDTMSMFCLCNHIPWGPFVPEHRSRNLQLSSHSLTHESHAAELECGTWLLYRPVLSSNNLISAQHLSPRRPCVNSPLSYIFIKHTFAPEKGRSKSRSCTVSIARRKHSESMLFTTFFLFFLLFVVVDHVIKLNIHMLLVKNKYVK